MATELLGGNSRQRSSAQALQLVMLLGNGCSLLQAAAATHDFPASFLPFFFFFSALETVLLSKQEFPVFCVPALESGGTRGHMLCAPHAHISAVQHKDCSSLVLPCRLLRGDISSLPRGRISIFSSSCKD